MNFMVDKQTLEDLNILGKFRPQSVYSIFNKVITSGGERLLESMFRHPLTDHESINTRSRLISFFAHDPLQLPFTRDEFDSAENYLQAGVPNTFLFATIGMARKKIMQLFLRDEQWEQTLKGLKAAVVVLSGMKGFLHTIKISESHPYGKQLEEMTRILSGKKMNQLLNIQSPTSFSLWKVAEFDFLLKKTLRIQIEKLLEYIYALDVFTGVSKVAHEKGFSFATAFPSDQNLLKTSGVKHPALDKGVANALQLDASRNMLFLTGANMAGKSTFMKSIGIAVYLAHMGFPVAASDMQFSVRDGIYTSINVPDNIHLGYSHFYAEVMRVKQAAQQVSSLSNVLVIFDELFKGTNVKDAYDATLAVSDAFSAFTNALFVISTHIVEVGHALQEDHEHIQFAYLPTVMNGSIPGYPYLLEKGITGDRHGMMIIQNEGILELLS